MNTATVDAIVEAALDGVVKAQVLYEVWSGGLWLWNAPEYLITVEVARQIMAQFNQVKPNSGGFLTLEQDVGELLKRIGASADASGRVDIALWHPPSSDGYVYPRAVIEIKNVVYDKRQYKGDIQRMRALLTASAQHPLAFAMFLYCNSDNDGGRKNATEKLKSRQAAIKAGMKAALGPKFLADQAFVISFPGRPIRIESDSAWVVDAILMQRLA
jgi:hypothetical protein